MAELRGYSNAEEVDTYRDCAKILGVDLDATDEEIDDKFTELVKEWHPDIGGDNDVMAAITTASSNLKDFNADTDDPDRRIIRGPGGSAKKGTGASTTTGASATGSAKQAGKSDDSGSQSRQSGQQGGKKTYEDIKDAVEKRLRNSGQYHPLIAEFGYEAVAEVLAFVIINGGATLGDVNKFMQGGDFFSANTNRATGGTYATGSRQNAYGSGSTNYSNRGDDAWSVSDHKEDFDFGDDDDNGDGG